MSRQDKTRQDKTRQDKTRQDKTRQDKIRYDILVVAFHSVSRLTIDVEPQNSHQMNMNEDVEQTTDPRGSLDLDVELFPDGQNSSESLQKPKTAKSSVT